MRVFLFGMQSSGASLATYLLGQTPRSVVLVDLYSYAVMPPIEAPGAEHVIGKAVITATHALEDHLQSYRPDRSILVLRDPVQNYVSLSRKEYANDDGTLEEKFRILDDVFRRREDFDLVLRYEDVVSEPDRVVEQLRGIGFPVVPDIYSLPRARDEIVEYNLEHCEWCRERYGRGWSFGNIRGNGMKQALVYKVAPQSVQDAVRELCPELYRYYQTGTTAQPTGTARMAALAEDLVLRRIRKGASRVREAAWRFVGAVLRSIRG